MVSGHEFHLGDSVLFEPGNIPGGLSSSEVSSVINRVDLTNGSNDIGDVDLLMNAMQNGGNLDVYDLNYLGMNWQQEHP